MNCFSLYWILGHLGFIGNEKANKLAKVVMRLNNWKLGKTGISADPEYFSI